MTRYAAATVRVRCKSGFVANNSTSRRETQEKRATKLGVVLLPTLVGIAFLIVLLSFALRSSQVTIDRAAMLIAANDMEAGKWAVHEALRLPVLQSMIDGDGVQSSEIYADGREFEIRWDETTWIVSAQDPEGLLDIFQSPIEAFDSASPALKAVSDRLRSAGDGRATWRSSSLEQSLARMEVLGFLGPSDLRLLTHSSERSRLNEPALPLELKHLPEHLPDQFFENRQTSAVTISVRRRP